MTNENVEPRIKITYPDFQDLRMILDPDLEELLCMVDYPLAQMEAAFSEDLATREREGETKIDVSRSVFVAPILVVIDEKLDTITYTLKKGGAPGELIKKLDKVMDDITSLSIRVDRLVDEFELIYEGAQVQHCHSSKYPVSRHEECLGIVREARKTLYEIFEPFVMSLKNEEEWEGF